MSEITLTQAAADIAIHLQIGRPVLLTGPVGVGKTDVARAAAHAWFDWLVKTGQLNAKQIANGLLIVDRRASQMTATDVTLPFPDHATGRVRNFVPDWLP